MNNNRPLACKIENSVTINCESSLSHLSRVQSSTVEQTIEKLKLALELLHLYSIIFIMQTLTSLFHHGFVRNHFEDWYRSTVHTFFTYLTHHTKCNNHNATTLHYNYIPLWREPPMYRYLTFKDFKSPSSVTTLPVMKMLFGSYSTMKFMSFTSSPESYMWWNSHKS